MSTLIAAAEWFDRFFRIFSVRRDCSVRKYLKVGGRCRV